MSESIINIFNGNKQVSKDQTMTINIHPDFKSTKILNFIGDLITTYGYKSFNDLSFDEQAEIASLLIEVDDPLEFIGNTRLITKSISQALNHQTLNSQENLIETLKTEAVDYYYSIIRSIFDYVLEDYESERKSWLDQLVKQGDPDEAYDRYFANLI